MPVLGGVFRCSALRRFARTLGTMTEGELRQLFGRTGVPSRAEYEYRIYAKTASMNVLAATSPPPGPPESRRAAVRESPPPGWRG